METIDSMLFVLRPRAGQRGRHLQAQRGQRFGQAFAQRGGRSSVQVRPGTERHGALDRIESDKDELLRDQHDLSVFRTRGRG